MRITDKVDILVRSVPLLLLVVLVVPTPSSPQSLTSSYGSCDPNPIRRDNEYTRTPYDDISYYECMSVTDTYDPNSTQVQSRQTCGYVKLVYYDRYSGKWTARNDRIRCTTRIYAKKEEGVTTPPDGWHPPLVLPRI